MKIKMCRCFMCKYGLRNSKREKEGVTYRCRHARRHNRQLLKSGNIDKMYTAVGIGYIG